MSADKVRLGVRDLLAAVVGIGTVDTAALDVRAAPQKLRALTANPYWSVTISRMQDQPATFGAGSSTRPVFRFYEVRVEGWRGFVAASEVTTDWERLVDGVLHRLEVSQAALAQILLGVGLSGFIALEDVRAEELGIREITEGDKSYRAHHAVITARARVYQVLS